jgi:hypothetical protein
MDTGISAVNEKRKRYIVHNIEYHNGKIDQTYGVCSWRYRHIHAHGGLQVLFVYLPFGLASGARGVTWNSDVILSTWPQC